MRLSTSMMYANGLKGVLSQETDMNRLVEQIGSGRKFLTPADDPLAAALSINVAQTQSMNATYQLNRNTAKTNLGQENNVLDSVTTALESVRTRVVQAGNGTMSGSDRQALSTALKSAREALLGLANSERQRSVHVLGLSGQCGALRTERGRPGRVQRRHGRTHHPG